MLILLLIAEVLLLVRLGGGYITSELRNCEFG